MCGAARRSGGGLAHRVDPQVGFRGQDQRDDARQVRRRHRGAGDGVVVGLDELARPGGPDEMSGGTHVRFGVAPRLPCPPARGWRTRRCGRGSSVAPMPNGDADPKTAGCADCAGPRTAVAVGEHGDDADSRLPARRRSRNVVALRSSIRAPGVVDDVRCRRPGRRRVRASTGSGRGSCSRSRARAASPVRSARRTRDARRRSRSA